MKGRKSVYHIKYKSGTPEYQRELRHPQTETQRCKTTTLEGNYTAICYPDAHSAVERMISRNERKEYWALPIAFDCPITGKRHTIDECFRKCQESRYVYAYVPATCRTSAFMYCGVDAQERYLHDGKVRRDL